jgi:hypothetical protein
MVWTNDIFTAVPTDLEISSFCRQRCTTSCEVRLYKVRPIIDSLVGKFRSTSVPEKEIAVDEGNIAWKGRLMFRVYIPDKPDKYGIKA